MRPPRCDRCDAGVPAGSRFCPACGAPFDSGNAPTVAGDDSAGAAAADDRFSPGTILDHRYRIVGRLGRGGMGEVYRADDLRLNQPVALKLLPAGLARESRRLEQFHNEVRTARQVGHPNVCRVYDIGADDEQVYLSMEFIDGEDLAASIRRLGRFREDKALDLARQICAGLAAVHDRGVVHRDLKPGNIMLDAGGRVRLMDFGLASIGAVAATRDGTPAYMAPEQFDGEGATPRTDIYALGLVLYELFTGRRAFTAARFDELRSQQVSGDVTLPTEIVRGLDLRIEHAILRCLDPDPARRPGSALAVSLLLPGSDPLAAALAAGETPSPELVAAAGGETAMLSGAAGLALMAATIALLIGVSWWSSLGTVIGQSDIRTPGVVLAARAEDIRRAAGGSDIVATTAWGFEYDRPALAWYARSGGPGEQWRGLAAGRPPGLRFWLRTSAAPLDPADPTSPVTRADPALTRAGDALVDLDSTGRLLRFVMMPPADALAPSGGPPDWPALFQYAALDASRLTPVAASHVPPAFADAVLAWDAASADPAVGPRRVEAASLGGRVVAFEVIGPWEPPSTQSAQSRAEYLAAFATAAVIAGLVVLMLWLAVVNVRTGRADWRRASRLALVGFTVELLRWLMVPAHSSDPSREVTRFLGGAASAFLHGGVFGAAYLGFEPYVRKYWPRSLIGWTRLTGRQARDPVVGRDLLVGTVWGLVNGCLTLSYSAAPQLVGMPSPPGWLVMAGPLAGTAMVFVTLGAMINLSMVNGLVGTFVVALLRRLSTSLWVVVPASMVIFGLLGDPAYTIESGRARLQVFWIATSFVPAIVAIRYGLLAMIAAALAYNLTANAAFTLNPDYAYFQASVIPAALILATALMGWRLSRGRSRWVNG